MRQTLSIAERELKSFFFSPIAYVVITLFVFIAAVFFLTTSFNPSGAAEMSGLFRVLIVVLAVITPAISMRLISEELNAGTIETLATSPINDTHIVLGKWLGALAFYTCMLLPTMMFVFVLELFADPDYGPIGSGYLGLLLVGGLYLAIGTLASALTRNQIIAFVFSVILILVLTVLTYYLPGLIGASAEPLLTGNPTLSTALPIVLGVIAAGAALACKWVTRSGTLAVTAGVIIATLLGGVWALVAIPSARDLAGIVSYLNVNQRFEDFARGLIDLSDIVFLVSTTALFLALSILTMETRRWR